MRRFDVQRLQHLRVPEAEAGQARREGQGGEEAGDHQGGEGDDKADAEVGAAGPPTRGIVEDELVHRRFASPARHVVSRRLALRARPAATMPRLAHVASGSLDWRHGLG